MNNIKVPMWFSIVSGLALLWNFMGLGAFFGHMTMTPEAIAQLPIEQQGLYATQPLWAKIAFGGSVIFGVIGSLALLLKKSWSRTVLGLSLAFVCAHMASNFMANAYNIMGGGTLVMGMMILGFAIFLVWLAGYGRSKGYLTS